MDWAWTFGWLRASVDDRWFRTSAWWVLQAACKKQDVPSWKKSWSCWCLQFGVATPMTSCWIWFGAIMCVNHIIKTMSNLLRPTTAMSLHSFNHLVLLLTLELFKIYWTNCKLQTMPAGGLVFNNKKKTTIMTDHLLTMGVPSDAGRTANRKLVWQIWVVLFAAHHSCTTSYSWMNVACQKQ